jgi:hypothetical protein
MSRKIRIGMALAYTAIYTVITVGFAVCGRAPLPLWTRKGGVTLGHAALCGK